MPAGWMHDEFSFTPDEGRILERVRGLLDVRMASARRRHAHSLGVAATAASLAFAYNVNAFDAYAAGLIHDWDKVLDDDELLARALRYGIEIEGAPALAVPLLHGPVAARELPELFPELDRGIFQAVARHTVAATDMTPLDMVVFTADAIEPGRRGDYADRLREMVGDVSLEELFFTCFAQGLIYVMQTKRYLYPSAARIYNHYVLNREKGSL